MIPLRIDNQDEPTSVALYPRAAQRGGVYLDAPIVNLRVMTIPGTRAPDRTCLTAGFRNLHQHAKKPGKYNNDCSPAGEKLKSQFRI